MNCRTRILPQRAGSLLERQAAANMNMMAVPPRKCPWRERAASVALLAGFASILALLMVALAVWGDPT